MWARIWLVIKPLFKNKYFVTTLAFIIWIGLFDENNLIERYRLAARIRTAEMEKEHYIEEIDQNKRKLTELKSNRANLEKFAREQYYMKKKNEVIFVVVED
jgi:cell division protein DivIC